MIRDVKSEAVFLAVDEDPKACLPFPLQFAEVLSPLFAECWKDPKTEEWKILPPMDKTTHTTYTRSGSTHLDVLLGWGDNDQDDEQTWES